MATKKTSIKPKKSTRRIPPPKDCPLDESLKLLAGKWTPKIIYFLRMGPRFFGDLRRDLDSISTKTLTQRLRALEKEGVINRVVHTTSPIKVEYHLTDIGRELGPILDAMVEVASKLRKKEYRHRF